MDSKYRSAVDITGKEGQTMRVLGTIQTKDVGTYDAGIACQAKARLWGQPVSHYQWDPEDWRTCLSKAGGLVFAKQFWQSFFMVENFPPCHPCLTFRSKPQDKFCIPEQEVCGSLDIYLYMKCDGYCNV